MKVTLISHTPDPERLIACAAKLCYSPSSIAETQEKLSDESVRSFVKMLAAIGHESPLEHISFTFGIEGVSRALLAQITRHRIASYSVQSQRYVKNFDFEYVMPPEIMDVPEAKKEFLLAMKESQIHYDKITEILKKKHADNLIESGADAQIAEKAAEKIAIEDARYVLPNACTTKIICTFNARSLLNFFEHRCCNRAQWEIRDLATKMLKLVREKAPSVFAGAGPACFKKSCPEGKMSCGKIKQVRVFFENL
jgi:thymidylate synthase (FAD)